MANSSRVVKNKSSTSSQRSVLSPTITALIVAPAVILGLVAALIVLWEQWYTGPMFNTPVDLLLIMDHHSMKKDRRLWNSYRPGVHFSMQSRIPSSLSVGMMWFVYEEHKSSDRSEDIKLIHTCQSTNWTRHDGYSFGQQTITDNQVLLLKSEFISDSVEGHGNTWTTRISADSRNKLHPSLLSLIIYVYNEGNGAMGFHGNKDKGIIEEIYGYTSELKEFRIHFPHRVIISNTVEFTNKVHSYSLAHVPRNVNMTSVILDNMQKRSVHKKWPLLHLLYDNHTLNRNHEKINFIAYQITAALPYPLEIDMVFESGLYSAAMSISGNHFIDAMKIKNANFDKRFENNFKLISKGFNASDILLGKYVLSNLLGSIKYQYNNIRVVSEDITEPMDYFPSSLLTVVPSCTNPIGSLTHEGFYQLLILHWSMNISKVVIGHWLDLMNIDGWIPGHWSMDRNNGQFVQDTSQATAPSLFLTLESLINKMEKENEMDITFLKQVYPRLEIWFDWFNITQAGPKPMTYRWVGRTKTTGLNPKTPMSGFDDFPRASNPSYKEYHLDLRCWMALAAKIVTRISDLIGESSKYYALTYQELTDAKILDKLHWDTKRKMYSDYGFHTSSVKLQRNSSGQFVRVVSGKPSEKFISALGYPSIFPLLLRLLPPDSSKLGYVLKQVYNKSLLWSDFGLRSLAKNNIFYRKPNFPGEEYVWRGPIHIHMNYLALRALHYYSNMAGPYVGMAKKIYTQLRTNVIETVTTEYFKTGSLWTYYDDVTGNGKGTSENSKMSSLIILIMAEKYY